MSTSAATDAGPSNSPKPIPDPDDEATRPYWDAARRGKLELQKCQACGEFHHPPQAICRHCLSTELHFEELSGHGTIYTFSVIRDQRMPAFDDLVPYIIAMVTLDEAPKIMLTTNIVDTPIDDVRCDMRVEVTFEEIAAGVRIPQFRKA